MTEGTNAEIIELGLDLRTARRLEAQGVETVAQLRTWRGAHQAGSDDIGRVMLAEIDRFLADHPPA